VCVYVHFLLVLVPLRVNFLKGRGNERETTQLNTCQSSNLIFFTPGLSLNVFFYLYFSLGLQKVLRRRGMQRRVSAAGNVQSQHLSVWAESEGEVCLWSHLRQNLSGTLAAGCWGGSLCTPMSTGQGGKTLCFGLLQGWSTTGRAALLIWSEIWLNIP